MRAPFTTSAARSLAVAALLAVPGLAAAQNAPLERALGALSAKRTSLGLLATDVAEPAVTSQHTDEHTGITHIYLRQRHQGVEVFGAVADVHVNQAGKVADLHSSFRTNVATAARAATPSLSPEKAVAAAARALRLPAPGNLQVVKAGTAAEGMEFSHGGISLENIPVKLMYLPMPDGELRLVWDVTIAPTSAEHYWSARVDAATGELLDKTDYTIHDSFSMSELTQPIARLASADAPTPTSTTANKLTATNSYNVWPITVESPIHGARQVVTNPADARVSPFGWHDTNGVAGAESNLTRGNNVQAYDDRGNANKYSASSISPSGGPELIFNYPFNASLSASPNENLPAAVVNLFYWNNIMHDVMAVKGFDEASGNFQVKNYSGRGTGNDDVQAEAQDASMSASAVNLNNANFATPAEGARPRMQMYLWDFSELVINVVAPASLAGKLNAREGSLGKKLAAVGPITGNLVLANDGTATPTLACNAFTNAADVRNNIALVERGGGTPCGFAVKIRNAQNAGAKMVVVMDNLANAPLITMGGTDTVGLRIPSIFISKSDGDRLKTALQAGQTVSINAAGNYYLRDGDFDNGIVAHEYGHGISSRLTGGASNANCLTSAEQMGEGWSDFFALWMTTKPGDVGTTPRGIGTYATFQPTTGGGIRPKPYSTNFQVNDATYALVGTGNYNTYEDAENVTRVQVHNIGYIWASTLWDMNWALIEKHGYNPDLTAATGGNNLALQLVIDGCKLQKCNPGFIDGRNAILKADSINNKAANSALIWRAFARRGMGFSAKQGDANKLTDQTIAYDLPAILSNRKQLSEALLEVYPNPANSQVVVRTQVSSAVPVQVELVSLLGQRVSTQTVSSARLQQEGTAINTAALRAGIYIVRLTTSEGIITKKVVVQH
ncbi:T9SS-dependent M36 family metallopeptidase [Hymenobacter tenuis]